MGDWKACPECGDIQELESNINAVCYKCRMIGHLYRMMTISELFESAKNDSKSGYELVAIRKHEIIIKLSRIATITEDSKRRLCIWRMWFGRTFNIHYFDLAA